MTKFTKLALAAAVAASASGGAAAYEAGDFIVRVGAATVAPNEESNAINLPTEPVLSLPGISIDSDTQVGLVAAYMFSDQFGVELLAATPFEHDFKVDGLGIDGGSVTHLPPTLSLQWYPRGGQEGWQPYFGVGVNYTLIYDEEVSGVLGDTLGAVLGANRTDLDLDNSVGASAQMGVDIPLNDNWGLNVGVWYIDIASTATIKTDVGNVSFDLEIDPWVYNVGIAYRF